MPGVLLPFGDVEPTLKRYLVADGRMHPPFPLLGKDGVEVTFEEGAGVSEVLFGVGFGGRDILKRFVEDADDPPLL